jgi:hypothetical protein
LSGALDREAEGDRSDIVWYESPNEKASAKLKLGILLERKNLLFRFFLSENTMRNIWVAGSKAKPLGMADARGAIPKLRSRMPPISLFSENRETDFLK